MLLKANLFVRQNGVLFLPVRQLADYMLLYQMLNEKSYFGQECGNKNIESLQITV
jgi:hypothetical protein